MTRCHWVPGSLGVPERPAGGEGEVRGGGGGEARWDTGVIYVLPFIICLHIESVCPLSGGTWSVLPEEKHSVPGGLEGVRWPQLTPSPQGCSSWAGP